MGGDIIKYIGNRRSLCHKCLEDKDNIKIYGIYHRGYGSLFDNDNETIQICDTCRKGIEVDLDKWINEIPKCIDGVMEEYKHEEKLVDFINNLPIQGREIVINQTSWGSCAENMDSQDWIDIELGIASDDVYKRNGMYTPSEMKLANKGGKSFMKLDMNNFDVNKELNRIKDYIENLQEDREEYKQELELICDEYDKDEEIKNLKNRIKFLESNSLGVCKDESGLLNKVNKF